MGFTRGNSPKMYIALSHYRMRCFSLGVGGLDVCGATCSMQLSVVDPVILCVCNGIRSINSSVYLISDTTMTSLAWLTLMRKRIQSLTTHQLFQHRSAGRVCPSQLELSASLPER